MISTNGRTGIRHTGQEIYQPWPRRVAVTSRGSRQRPPGSRLGPFRMESVTSNRLRVASSWLLITSLLACVAGAAWTVAEAPCSKVGATLLLGAVVLGVFSAGTLFVRAFLAHPIRSILACIAICLLCAIEYFISYTLTPLLCRGV